MKTDLDILIVGGGVIGLSIARELRRNGAAGIAVIDKGVCSHEASWAAAGMLAPHAEANESGQFFDLCRESLALYPDFSAALLEETGVDIELDRSGTLYLAFTDEDVREIGERFEWQRRAGLAVEHLSVDETRKAEPFVSPDVQESLYFPNDWQVDNRKLCTALRTYAEMNGISILENTVVEGLAIENDRVIGVSTSNGLVRAENVVLATGAWTSLIHIGNAQLPFSVEPVRGQMIAYRSAERLFTHVIYTPRGYIVPRLDGRILAGSTSERVGFDGSVTDRAVSNIAKMAEEISPSVAALEIKDKWAGLRPFVADALPVLGPVNGIGGLCVATGHYRNGILLAPITGRLIADHLVSGAMPGHFEAFGAARFQPLTAGVA